MLSTLDSVQTRAVALPGRAPGGGTLTLQVAEAGSSASPALLCLHGYTDSWYSFSRVAPLLMDSWHLIIPSQRGHGESDQPLSGYTPGEMALDALAVMDALGIPSATVVGHSMGSFVARRLAVMHSARVDSLILIGSAPRLRNAVTEGILREVDEFEERVDPAFVRAFQESTIARPVPEEFLAAVIRESLKLPSWLWKSVLREFMDADDHGGANTITCPTRIVGGTQDSVFPPEDQRELARSIPNATIFLEERAGHALHWEMPGAFVDEVFGRR